MSASTMSVLPAEERAEDTLSTICHGCSPHAVAARVCGAQEEAADPGGREPPSHCDQIEMEPSALPVAARRPCGCRFMACLKAPKVPPISQYLASTFCAAVRGADVEKR